MSDKITKEGFPYTFSPSACDSCEGRCCTGESGYIWLTNSERKTIAEHLGLDEARFIQDYLRKEGYKYSIKEVLIEGSYNCVFYDKGCGIYDVRPLQCRTYPFWDYFKTNTKELVKECPGINQ